MTIICAVFSILLIVVEMVFICSKTFNFKNEKSQESRKCYSGAEIGQRTVEFIFF